MWQPTVAMGILVKLLPPWNEWRGYFQLGIACTKCSSAFQLARTPSKESSFLFPPSYILPRTSLPMLTCIWVTSRPRGRSLLYAGQWGSTAQVVLHVAGDSPDLSSDPNTPSWVARAEARGAEPMMRRPHWRLRCPAWGLRYETWLLALTETDIIAFNSAAWPVPFKP